MAVAQQKTSVNLIHALYNLSREHDTQMRQDLLNAGLVEKIKWFSLAARKILEGKMKLPKQTQTFMDRHKDDMKKLASAMVDPEIKRSIILKPGGGGYFGGTIIRSHIRWDGNKFMRKFGKKDQLRNHLRKLRNPQRNANKYQRNLKSLRKVLRKQLRLRKRLRNVK